MKLLKDKGISLYLTMTIMSILLALALGVSAILYSQIKVTKGMGDSVFAFYAADTGIERELYEENEPGTYSDYLDLNQNGYQDSNDSSYTVTVTAGGESNCPEEANRCIKSVGDFKGTKRAILVVK